MTRRWFKPRSWGAAVEKGAIPDAAVVGNDPVAAKTGWQPLASGGTNICTHRLKETKPGCCRFEMTRGAKLFVALFGLMGIGIPGIIAHEHWVKRGGEWLAMDFLMPIVIGAVFVGVSFFFWRQMSRPRVFDRNYGLYWSVHTPPERLDPAQRYQSWVYLQEVHALQIVEEYVRGDKSSYYSYELNLVMDDGQRLNVVDHGSVKKLREDADLLAKFLGVPLWDATQGKG